MVYVYAKNEKDNKGKLISEIEENFNDFNQEQYAKDKKSKLYFSEEKYLYPIIENNKVRMKTREEFILEDGIYDYIIDGEFIENGQIKRVEIPKGMINPVWNKKNKKWYEGTNKYELMEIRKNKILKYANLKKEVEVLEKFQNEFEANSTIEMVKNQLLDLKEEINNLYNIIKSL